jgi:hypothetical protein
MPKKRKEENLTAGIKSILVTGMKSIWKVSEWQNTREEGVPETTKEEYQTPRKSTKHHNETITDSRKEKYQTPVGKGTRLQKGEVADTRKERYQTSEWRSSRHK